MYTNPTGSVNVRVLQSTPTCQSRDETCRGRLDRPGFCGGVMPWRAGRRRVRGRRRWPGGVGCGCTGSPIGRWRPRGSSRRNGPRACSGLPRAWAAALSQEDPTAPADAPGALVDESPGAGRWTGDLDPWSLWWTRPPGVAAVAVLARPDGLFQGASRVVGAPCAR